MGAWSLGHESCGTGKAAGISGGNSAPLAAAAASRHHLVSVTLAPKRPSLNEPH